MKTKNINDLDIPTLDEQDLEDVENEILAVYEEDFDFRNKTHAFNYDDDMDKSEAERNRDRLEYEFDFSGAKTILRKMEFTKQINYEIFEKKQIQKKAKKSFFRKRIALPLIYISIGYLLLMMIITIAQFLTFIVTIAFTNTFLAVLGIIIVSSVLRLVAIILDDM